MSFSLFAPGLRLVAFPFQLIFVHGRLKMKKIDKVKTLLTYMKLYDYVDNIRVSQAYE